MNRAEILQALRQIQGRCDITTCQLVPECELASQVASELDQRGKSDSIEYPGYQRCTNRKEVMALRDAYEAVEG